MTSSVNLIGNLQSGPLFLFFFSPFSFFLPPFSSLLFPPFSFFFSLPSFPFSSSLLFSLSLLFFLPPFFPFFFLFPLFLSFFFPFPFFLFSLFLFSFLFSFLPFPCPLFFLPRLQNFSREFSKGGRVAHLAHPWLRHCSCHPLKFGHPVCFRAETRWCHLSLTMCTHVRSERGVLTLSADIKCPRNLKEVFSRNIGTFCKVSLS